MTRAVRRRVAAAEQKGRQRWDLWLDECRRHDSGLLSIEIIRRGDGRLDAAVPIAHWAVQAIERPDGAVCLGCPKALGPRPKLPAAFGLVRSAPEPGALSLVVGVCEDCARQSDCDLIEAVVRHLRTILPSLRAIELANLHMHAGGRA